MRGETTPTAHYRDRQLAYFRMHTMSAPVNRPS